MQECANNPACLQCLLFTKVKLAPEIERKALYFPLFHVYRYINVSAVKETISANMLLMTVYACNQCGC
jgi:hypothetical protein